MELIVAVTDADGVCVAEIVAVDVTLAVCDGETPRVSVAVIVFVALADADGAAVGEAEHAMKSVCTKLALSRIETRVLLSASSTESVLLMARVSHVPAIPAAVHEAGGVQQDGVWGLRLWNTTRLSSIGAPRSMTTNSDLVVPRLRGASEVSSGAESEDRGKKGI